MHPRYAVTVFFCVLFVACSSSSESNKPPDASGPFDGSSSIDAATGDGSTTADAAGDGGTAATPRRLIIPRIRETAEALADAVGAVDTIIQLVHRSVLGGSASAEVELWLYGDDGSLVEADGGTTVCGPCEVTLSASKPNKVFSIDALVKAAGGFAAAELVAHAVLEIAGDDPGGVAVGATTETALADGNRHIDQAQVVEQRAGAPGRFFFGPTREVPGDPASTPYMVDTEFIFVNAGPGDNGARRAASVDLYLYGQDGLLLQGESDPVCGPCTLPLDNGAPVYRVTVEELLHAASAELRPTDVIGVVEISGDGAADTVGVVELAMGTAESGVVSHSPVPLFPERPAGSSGDLFFVTSHLQDDLIGEFVVVTNFAGLGATPSGATFEHYFYDGATGQPMRSATNAEICNPCQGTAGTPRGAIGSLYDSAQAVGGLPDPAPTGYAVTRVSGAEAKDTFVFRETLSYDNGVRGAGPSQQAGGTVDTFVFPHLLENSVSILDPGQNAFDTTVFVTYTAGQGGLSGTPADATVNLYLFDEATGQPIKSDDNAEVCNPCSFPMGTDGASGAKPRKRKIDLHNVLTDGGFFTATRKLFVGFGVITVEGADPDGVGVFSTVTNAVHGPTDLRVFAFDPQPIVAAP